MAEPQRGTAIETQNQREHAEGREHDRDVHTSGDHDAAYGVRLAHSLGVANAWIDEPSLQELPEWMECQRQQRTENAKGWGKREHNPEGNQQGTHLHLGDPITDRRSHRFHLNAIYRVCLIHSPPSLSRPTGWRGKLIGIVNHRIIHVNQPLSIGGPALLG